VQNTVAIKEGINIADFITLRDVVCLGLPLMVSVSNDYSKCSLTPKATTPSQHLPQSFFCRPTEVIAPELIGCLLVKCQPAGELLWGLIV